MNEEEINIKTVRWTSPEHPHKENSVDWYWTIGIITIIIFIFAIWTKNYVFAIFIFVSGASLELISIRHPQEVEFIIENRGFTIGKDFYEWSRVKCFDIKKGDSESRLLIELNKYFLPVYTVHIQNELIEPIKEAFTQVIPRQELEESRSVLFMEKLGF